MKLTLYVFHVEHFDLRPLYGRFLPVQAEEDESPNGQSREQNLSYAIVEHLVMESWRVVKRKF